jgi:hypothetical protein
MNLSLNDPLPLVHAGYTARARQPGSRTRTALGSRHDASDHAFLQLLEVLKVNRDGVDWSLEAYFA